MPDRRNPHNSYYYQQPGQASPIYVPPSKSTQRILPVPQREGQGDFHYGMPGQASPNYVPGSKKRMAKTYVKSDERSKTEIRKLEEKNAALTAALEGDQGSPGEYMRSVAPKSGAKYAERYSEGLTGAVEYPYTWDARDHGGRAVPGNGMGPMQARFADAPDPADTVAAQNVAMAPPPAPPPMAPRPVAPAWNPTAGNAPPDLSALDEAYRRIGASQGS